MTNAEESQKIEFSLYVKTLGYFLHIFATKTAAILCSIIVVVCFYIFDSYNQKYMLFSGSGTIVVVFGLILTLKHSYLLNIKSVGDFIVKQNGFMKFISTESKTDPENISKAKTAATDEGTGVLIMILGSLISALAPLVPLINL